MTTLTTVRGGSWLIDETAAESVFTPEQLSDEHRLIGQTADEFVTNEVQPALERLEQKDWQLAKNLVRRAGELGPRTRRCRAADSRRQRCACS